MLKLKKNSRNLVARPTVHYKAVCCNRKWRGEENRWTEGLEGQDGRQGGTGSAGGRAGGWTKRARGRVREVDGVTAKEGLAFPSRREVGSGVSLQRLAAESADDAEVEAVGVGRKAPEGEAGLAVFFAD
ncbi:hypothetical protein KM043_002196 [Ampulex compressa]|nr:hypothetical protein KM043_002196 [Ampulex compressa]